MEADTAYDPQEARREALENGSGFSSYDVGILLGTKTLSASVELPERPDRKKPHRGSHVRGFSDGELRDGEAQTLRRGPELSPEEAAKSAAALDKSRDLRRALQVQELERQVEVRIPVDPTNPSKSYEDRQRLLQALLTQKGLSL